MGQLRFGEAEPFEVLPLTWDRAYGGRDAHAEDRLHPKKSTFTPRAEAPRGAIAYPRNPAGRGFFLDLDRERLEGALLPNLEDPEDAVTPEGLLAKSALDWFDRPIAACYGPVDWMSFPRVALWLGAAHDPPARPSIEVRTGALRLEDLRDRPLGAPPEPRVYNCAPAGLSGVRLQGGEPVSVWNMHARHEVWECHLPGERPRLWVSPPGCGMMEMTPTLQTVLVEPELDRVTLTWSGTLEVAAPFPAALCCEMTRVVKWER
jgi:hypothetical protein